MRQITIIDVAIGNGIQVMYREGNNGMVEYLGWPDKAAIREAILAMKESITAEHLILMALLRWRNQDNLTDPNLLKGVQITNSPETDGITFSRV